MTETLASTLLSVRSSLRAVFGLSPRRQCARTTANVSVNIVYINSGCQLSSLISDARATNLSSYHPSNYCSVGIRTLPMSSHSHMYQDITSTCVMPTTTIDAICFVVATGFKPVYPRCCLLKGLKYTGTTTIVRPTSRSSQSIWSLVRFELITGTERPLSCVYHFRQATTKQIAYDQCSSLLCHCTSIVI